MDRSPHVLTVTLNLAQDLTYDLPALTPGTVHTVEHVAQRAGGKGVNVARVLVALGTRVTTTGLVGGQVGAEVQASLEAASLPHRLVTVTGATRRTVAIVDGAGVTLLNEPGPVILPAEWDEFVALFTSLLDTVDVVALSGSLPRGLGEDAYATLTRAARAAGRFTAVDATGPALSRVLATGPELVRVNLDEARTVTSRTATPAQAARELLSHGAQTAVVSLGADGMIAANPDGMWHAEAPRVHGGNPTGAGDTSMACLLLEQYRGVPLPESLARACALAATTVSAAVAGDADPQRARELLPQVTVRETTA